MRGEAGPAILGRIVAFQQDDLVGLHVGDIVPAVLRPVANRIDLARPVLIDQIRRHEIILAHTFRIAEGQRHILHRPSDRPPDIDHRKPVLEPGLGLRRFQKVPHALWSGFDRIVVVNVSHRLARFVFALFGLRRAAHVVIEDHNVRSAPTPAMEA